MNKERMFYQTDFCMDLSEGSFSGYTDGDTWNGFACPYFEHNEAARLLDELGTRWKYDKQKDAFTVWVPEVDEPDEFEVVMIQIGGNDIKTYAIGAYSWVWSICEQSNERRENDFLPS